MTTKNKIIIDKRLMSALVMLTIVPFTGNAFATNVNAQFWADATQTYVCTSDLQNDLSATGNVSICTDLDTSANRWNGISSSTWDLDTSGTGNDTNVKANSLSTGTLGVFSFSYNGSNEYVSGLIELNSDEDWGDTIDGDTGVYDYQSTATHEFGHLAGLAHTVNTSSVMYATLALNDDNRQPTAHDYQHLKDKY